MDCVLGGTKLKLRYLHYALRHIAQDGALKHFKLDKSCAARQNARSRSRAAPSRAAANAARPPPLQHSAAALLLLATAARNGLADAPHLRSRWAARAPPRDPALRDRLLPRRRRPLGPRAAAVEPRRRLASSRGQGDAPAAEGGGQAGGARGGGSELRGRGEAVGGSVGAMLAAALADGRGGGAAQPAAAPANRQRRRPALGRGQLLHRRTLCAPKQPDTHLHHHPIYHPPPYRPHLPSPKQAPAFHSSTPK